MFKAIKLTTLLCILFLILISILYTFNTSAAKPTDIFLCYSKIKISYDNKAANDPFLPIDRIKEINVTIDYFVEGYYAEQVTPYYGMENFIYLSIFSKPDWCTVTLSPDFLRMVATPEGIQNNITMIIQVNEDADALAIDTIGFEVKVDKLGAILGDTFKSNISFRPGYLPILNIIPKEKTIDQIGPLDNSQFKIEIENLGNAITRVTAIPFNVPEGWTASIVKDTVLGTGRDPLQESIKKTITLTVEPPNQFGYHNDREVIQISITPSYFEDSTLKGKEYFISFIVQSKGFSTPGFEISFVLAGIIIFVGILKKISKNSYIDNKIEEENEI